MLERAHGGHPNVLRTDQSVSLEEFVRRFIATPSDLDRLTELGRPNGPKTVSKPDLNVGSGRIFDPNPVTYSTGVTPEFVEQTKLSQRLQSEIRAALGSEDWQATGRRVGEFERIAIHPRHWQSLAINLESWTVGVRSVST
jgi:hypothetical protein